MAFAILPSPTLRKELVAAAEQAGLDPTEVDRFLVYLLLDALGMGPPRSDSRSDSADLRLDFDPADASDVAKALRVMASKFHNLPPDTDALLRRIEGIRRGVPAGGRSGPRTAQPRSKPGAEDVMKAIATHAGETTEEFWDKALRKEQKRESRVKELLGQFSADDDG